MTRTSTSLLVTIALALGVFSVAPPARLLAEDEPAKKEKEEKPKKSVDAELVYYGSPKAWESPAEVDADLVYAEIKEYKEIVDRGLTPTDAEYPLLLQKASRRFNKAVRKVAKDKSYDLVAATGAVKGVDDVPDITHLIIAEL